MKQYKIESDEDGTFVTYSDTHAKMEKILALPTAEHYCQVRDLLERLGYYHQNIKDYKNPFSS